MPLAIVLSPIHPELAAPLNDRELPWRLLRSTHALLLSFASIKSMNDARFLFQVFKSLFVVVLCGFYLEGGEGSFYLCEWQEYAPSNIK